MCCLLIVDCCPLRVVGWCWLLGLLVVRRVMFAILLVVCCLLFGVCCVGVLLLLVDLCIGVCYLLFVDRCLLWLDCRVLFVVF